MIANMSNGYNIWTVDHWPNGYPKQNLPYNGLLCRSCYSPWDDCLDRFTKQTSNHIPRAVARSTQ
jgi:hypothetical protein